MKINVKGYIGQDAKLREFKYTDKEGKEQTSYVTSISLAEKIRKGKNYVTVWHTITFWRNFAKAMAPCLTKGKRIEVWGEYGKVDTYAHDNKIEGTLNINAVEVEFLDKLEKPGASEPTEAELAEAMPEAELEVPDWIEQP